MRKSGLVYKVKRHFLSETLDKRQRNVGSKNEERKKVREKKKKKGRKERRDFLASRFI